MIHLGVSEKSENRLKIGSKWLKKVSKVSGYLPWKAILAENDDSE
jgi:hypothetical protein